MLEIQELKAYIDMDMNQFVTKFAALDDADLQMIKQVMSERLNEMKYLDNIATYAEKINLIDERLSSHNG